MEQAQAQNMFDDWAWRSYNRVLKEAKEPTPFKSAAQKRYKKQRRKNDIYSTTSGHKNLKTGVPFTIRAKRAGTDRLRFENLQEIIDDGIDFSSLEAKETLSPDIWESDQLKVEVSDQLKQVASDFVDSMGIEVGVEDILLVGSMAGHNWSKHSDIDLHVVLNFDEISRDKELLRKYFRLAKSKWNTTYDIKIYGHDVEVYVEDIEDEHIPSAIYSLGRQEWISQIDSKELTIDYEGVTKKVNEKINEIDELQLLYTKGEYKGAFELGGRLRSKIRNFRQSGLDQEGEFSNENLAFKVLRRSGNLDRMNEYVKRSYIEMRNI